MAFLRIPLDQATACTTALAINASVDFGIYLVADYQTALRNGHDLDGALYYALADRGRIITVDIVLNAICFAPLMLSSFLPVARLGWLVIVMLIACGVGALLIMPALLPWCVRGRGQTP
jgi:predicted RND superfamily exporter protein